MGITQDQLIALPLWYAVFLLSVTCHEAGHAFAALRGGDATAYLGGQVTLNPVPHIRREPFGTVVVPLMSYLLFGWTMGWASAPYDPDWEERHPRRAAVMAAAGPAANLILALIAFAVLKAGIVTEVWGLPATSISRLVHPLSGEPGIWEGLGRFCSVLLSLNVLLVLFNLVPFPPLDGAAIVAGLSERARELRDRLRAGGGGGLIGLVAAVLVVRYAFSPIMNWILDLLYG